MRTILSAALLGLSYTALIGCDAKPPTPPATPSSAQKATGSQPSANDLAAVKSFANEATGATTTPPAPPAKSGSAASGANGLPAGHPPIGGANVSPSASSAAAPSGGAAAPGGMPPGHPPVGGATPGDLKFDPPADWQVQPLKSAMRKAQYGIPKAEGDSEDGEVAVFFFGAGEGGGVKDNIERWKNQFSTADNRPLPPDAAKEETTESNGMKITFLDVSGRYNPGAMPGMAASGPKDNYRMIAAVIEAPSGAWFVKATAPGATMAKQLENVKKFVMTAKP